MLLGTELIPAQDWGLDFPDLSSEFCFEVDREKKFESINRSTEKSKHEAEKESEGVARSGSSLAAVSLPADKSLEQIGDELVEDLQVYLEGIENEKARESESLALSIVEQPLEVSLEPITQPSDLSLTKLSSAVPSVVVASTLNNKPEVSLEHTSKPIRHYIEPQTVLRSRVWTGRQAAIARVWPNSISFPSPKSEGKANQNSQPQTEVQLEVDKEERSKARAGGVIKFDVKLKPAFGSTPVGLVLAGDSDIVEENRAYLTTLGESVRYKKSSKFFVDGMPQAGKGKDRDEEEKEKKDEIVSEQRESQSDQLSIDLSDCYDLANEHLFPSESEEPDSEDQVDLELENLAALHHGYEFVVA